MGTTVLSGTAAAVASALATIPLIGELNSHLNEQRPPTSFEKGVNSVSVLLIRFMAVMVPIVFLINGFTKGNWISAGLFAISVAVGLTPEMLPMIVTTCLAKGAVTMSHEKGHRQESECHPGSWFHGSALHGQDRHIDTG
jgi:Mg2+-importing ATPase